MLLSNAEKWDKKKNKKLFTISWSLREGKKFYFALNCYLSAQINFL